MKLPATCPVFAVQLAVSAVGMALSVGMLFLGRDPAVYLPVVTSIVGYWLPAPKRPDPPPQPASTVANHPADSAASAAHSSPRSPLSPAALGST